MADDMPNKYSYDSQQMAPATQNKAIGPDSAYIRSLPGILKIVEMVLCLIAFICASIEPWGYLGGGWVQFVTISALIGILILFLFHFLHVISRLPGPWMLIEFIYYCVYTGCMLIAAIVAAARGWIGGSVAATAVFCFAALAVIGVDAFMMFRSWQAGRTSEHSGGEVSTTTTTTATREQY